jgi:hypothetical protein
MCTTYLFQMWGFFIHALFLHTLLRYFTKFTTNFVWFKFGHIQLDTLLKALLKHERKFYLLFCIYMQAGKTYKSTKVYVLDTEWDLSYFKVTATNRNKRMHYNHLYWHLFPFTISIKSAFHVVFCSICYYCSQTCLHQQNIHRITFLDFMNC